MRKNLVLGAAVAAALASGAASAANVNIYVSGSSALSSFFQADMGVNLCGYTAAAYKANLATAVYNDSSYTNYAPAFTAYQCTAVKANAAAGINIGDVVTLAYSAELGSTVGIYTGYTPAYQRKFLTPSAAGCAAGVYNIPPSGTKAGVVWPTPGSTSYCEATGYSHLTDANTNDPHQVLTNEVANIVVADVEPALFGVNGDNWPTANADPSLQTALLGPPPTAAQVATATAAMSVMNGQVFMVIGNGVPGVPNTTTDFSLSSTSLRAILTGNYTTWKQVPEVGGADTVATGTPINICRRDHGSGTELSADLTFAGNVCNLDGSGTAILSGTTLTYPGPATGWVYEAPASTDMKSCVTSATGTIGLLVNATPSASYATFMIDGVQATAHNAAAGKYPYAYENWAGQIGNQAASTVLLKDATDFTALTGDAFANETGSLKAAGAPYAGQWTATATNAVYAVLGASLIAASDNTRTAKQWATDPLPASLFSRGGDSCSLRNNENN